MFLLYFQPINENRKRFISKTLKELPNYMLFNSSILLQHIEYLGRQCNYPDYFSYGTLTKNKLFTSLTESSLEFQP